MSIAEFVDGMPSFDIRNFSRFKPHNNRNKPASVYISTVQTKDDQLITNRNIDVIINYLSSQLDKMDDRKEKDAVEIFEDANSKV